LVCWDGLVEGERWWCCGVVGVVSSSGSGGLQASTKHDSVEASENILRRVTKSRFADFGVKGVVERKDIKSIL